MFNWRVLLSIIDTEGRFNDTCLLIGYWQLRHIKLSYLSNSLTSKLNRKSSKLEKESSKGQSAHIPNGFLKYMPQISFPMHFSYSFSSLSNLIVQSYFISFLSPSKACTLDFIRRNALFDRAKLIALKYFVPVSVKASFQSKATPWLF